MMRGMRGPELAACTVVALLLQGCGTFGDAPLIGGLFGGGTPPCENPQMYQNAEASEPLVAPEGLETPRSFGNLEVPEGEVLEGLPRRSDGSCLEEPPAIERPAA